MVGIAPDSADCLAYYKFQNSGTDETGNESDAVLSGATYTSSGKIGYGVSCDGDNDYITIGNLGSAGTVKSFGMWIYNDVIQNNTFQGLIEFNGTGYSSSFGLISGSQPATTLIGFKVENLNKYYSWTETDLDVTEISIGWHFYLWVRDGTNYRLYFDDTDAGLGTQYNTTAEVDFGATILGRRGTSFLAGNFDEVQFYSTSLTSDNAYYLYNSGSPGSAQQYPFIQSHNYSELYVGLESGWDFKKDKKDFSGNGNDAIGGNGTVLTSNRFGIENSAYEYTSNSDWIDMGETTFLTNTKGYISMWINPSANNSIIWGATRRGFNAEFLSLYNSSGGTGLLNDRLYYKHTISPTSTILYTPEDSITPTSWNHVIVASSGTAIKIYINGVDQTLTVNSGTNDGTWFADIPSVDTFALGANLASGDTGNLYAGKIGTTIVSSGDMTDGLAKYIYDLEKSNFIYPYPKEYNGGITQ